MRYVIDSSTAFKWFVVEIHRPKAIKLRQDFENGACDLLAPDLFPTEVANALLMAEQGKNPRLAPGQAALFLSHLSQARAQEIAKQYKRSVYDWRCCQFRLTLL